MNRVNALATPIAAPGKIPATMPSTPPTRLPLWLVAALAALLLLIGAAKNFGAPGADIAEYHCYALAFLGRPLPAALGCAAFPGVFTGALSGVAAPFHTLPREYGPLALVAFVLPALGPAGWYAWLFAVELLLVVLCVALLLRHFGPPGAAHAWLFYAMLGSQAVAVARFDLLPAACTLLALVAMQRDRERWAYAALACGVLLKFYPLLLVPLFLIATWRGHGARTHWQGPGIFAAVILAGEGVAALLNPSEVLSPLRFMGARCVQVESLPATLAGIAALPTGGHVTFAYAFNAMCQSAPASGLATLLCLALGAAAYCLIVALSMRGRLTLATAAVAALCVAVLATKVFSPQYLLWISPLVAYAFGLRTRAFLAWSAVCIATTVCYPLAYASLLLPLLHTTSATVVPLAAGARNLLLVSVVALLLWRSARQGIHTRQEPTGEVTP